MNEEWRDIPGHEGYQVSSLGRVRSCWVGGWAGRKGKWKIRKPGLAGNGYPHLALGPRPGGGRFQDYVHRLVAFAFIGPRPEGMEVNHKDGVKTNNLPSNLEWVTHSENERHSIRIGLREMMEPLRGEAHPRAKLTQKQADEIREIYVSEKIGMARLAKRFGVTKVVVRNILEGESYSHANKPAKIARRSMKGDGNPSAKLTLEQAEEMRRLRADTGMSYEKLGKKFGVCANSAWEIIKGNSYQRESVA